MALSGSVLASFVRAVFSKSGGRSSLAPLEKILSPLGRLGFSRGGNMTIRLASYLSYILVSVCSSLVQAEPTNCTEHTPYRYYSSVDWGGGSNGYPSSSVKSYDNFQAAMASSVQQITSAYASNGYQFVEIKNGFWSEGIYPCLYEIKAYYFTIVMANSSGSIEAGGVAWAYRWPIDTPSTNENVGQTCPLIGHPFHIGTGNKYKSQKDYEGIGVSHLTLERFYNSLKDKSLSSAGNWSTNYDLSVQVSTLDGGYSEVTVDRPDGHVYSFKLEDGVWKAFSDEAGELVRVDDVSNGALLGWEYTTPENTLESYGAQGKLDSIVDRLGSSIDLTYDDDDRLRWVYGSYGNYLEFVYDNSDLNIDKIIDNTGRTWEYLYTTDGRLQTVVNPDLTTKQYHYEDSSNDLFLTGLTDERGIRYSYYTYDMKYGIVTSTLANNVDWVKIENISRSSGNRKVTNSLGNITNYTFESPRGRYLISDVSGPGCSTCGNGNSSYDYDSANNNLLSKTENGVTTDYGDYDTKAQYGYKIEAVGTPKERRTDYTYDSRFFNKITTIIEPSIYAGNNKVTTYTYDDFGNRLTESISGFKPDGNPIVRNRSWQYNGPLNQVSFADGPRLFVYDFTYYRYYADDVSEGNNRARLAEIEDATGVLTRSNIQYSATGKVLSETRPNGLAISYTYYPGNDRLETLTENDGTSSRVTQWTYLATGEVESITTGFGTTDFTTLTFGYDDARRLTRITDDPGNYIEYTLDTEGNRKEEKTYDRFGALKKQLSQTFDIYNRLDTTKQGDDPSVPLEATDPNFAPDGTLDTQTDGKGVVTDYSYDSLKRLTQVVQDLGGTDSTTADATTGYDYDVADRLTTVTDPINGNTIYAYDDLGNLVSQTSPDTGSTSFFYNAAGNLTARTDALGALVNYSYDALNRLTFMNATGTKADFSYVYDSCSNGIGHLCAVNNVLHNVSYSYNAFGDVTGQQSLTYSYDASGRLETITYPSGALITYDTDSAGQVTQVSLTVDGNTQVLASGVAHAPFGPMTALTYGNGASLSQSLDSVYRVTAQTTAGVLQRDYSQYDGNGNLKQRDDTLVSQIDSFNYDALNRLDTANGGFGSRDYDHDLNGNRTQLDAGGTPVSYSYITNSNRLTQVGSEVHDRDANGNTTQIGGRTFNYNVYNRLTKVTDGSTEVATYQYNGLGQRVSKTADGTTTRYHYGLDGQLMAETTNGGGSYTDYYYLDGQLVAYRVSTVSGSLVPRVTVTSSPAQIGQSLSVDWGGIINPTSTDWVGVYELGAPDNSYLDWDYTDGNNAGSRPLSLDHADLVPGNSYEVRLYPNDSYQLLATSMPFVLNPTGPTVAVTSAPAVIGSTIDVTWSGITTPTLYDWVGLYVPGTADNNYLDWEYTNTTDPSGAGSVSLTLSDISLVPGNTYEVRLYPNDGYSLLATSASFILEDNSSVSTASTLYYVHNDHLGTPQVLTDELGTTVWTAAYDPFGQATVDDDPDSNGTPVTLNVRFPGQYYDQETGLHYNYFRYYDPNTGRYMTSDPIGLDGGLNTYAYVGGNPLTRIDPTGQFFFLIPGVPAAAAAAGDFLLLGSIWWGLNNPWAANSDIGLGPWTDSTTRDDPGKAGGEAADEIIDEQGGSCDLSNPDACKAAASKCKQKCIDKALEGYGGSMDRWILKCHQSCTSKLGCGNYFP